MEGCEVTRKAILATEDDVTCGAVRGYSGMQVRGFSFRGSDPRRRVCEESGV